MNGWLAAPLMLALLPMSVQAQDSDRFAAFTGSAKSYMQAQGKVPDASFSKFATRYLKVRETRARSGGEQFGACVEAESTRVMLADVDGDRRAEGLIHYPWINCNAGNYTASVIDVFTLKGPVPQYAGTVQLGTSMVGFGEVTQIGKGVIKVSGDADRGLEPRTYRLTGGRLK